MDSRSFIASAPEPGIVTFRRLDELPPTVMVISTPEADLIFVRKMDTVKWIPFRAGCYLPMSISEMGHLIAAAFLESERNV